MSGLLSTGFVLTGSFVSVSAAGVHQLPDGRKFHMTSDKLPVWGLGHLCIRQADGKLGCLGHQALQRLQLHNTLHLGNHV